MKGWAEFLQSDGCTLRVRADTVTAIGEIEPKSCHIISDGREYRVCHPAKDVEAMLEEALAELAPPDEVVVLKPDGTMSVMTLDKALEVQNEILEKLNAPADDYELEFTPDNPYEDFGEEEDEDKWPWENGVDEEALDKWRKESKEKRKGSNYFDDNPYVKNLSKTPWTQEISTKDVPF